MEYVHKMAEAASEISFLAGMDNLSSSLTQRIDDAINKIQTEKTNNNDLELEYIRIQEASIKKCKKISQNLTRKKKRKIDEIN